MTYDQCFEEKRAISKVDFSFKFQEIVTGTFLRCHGQFLFFPKLSRAFFFVTGKILAFLSRALTRLSRAFFAVKIVTGIWAVFARVLKSCHGQPEKCHGEKKKH